ncbi:organic hydroperoxide resistance protein [Paenirhodobacter sp.]|uniref:organic hydroperoxide resistance protein n=1 Tax=Paenirhodobacter sp. TaxID=1965326 RepID=UPI003B41DAC4
MTTIITPAYSTTAIATGGRDGRSRTLDGAIDVKLATPKELGGPGGGNNPEQLFAAGYAACYLGAIKFAALQDKSLPRVPADITVEATVGIGPRPDKGFGLKVGLVVSLPGLTQDEADRLTVAGHGICPYSHATHGNIEVVTTTVL